MNNTQTSILIVFIIYIVFMVAVGFFFSRRKMSNADYVLGGRSLNPWVTAMSAQASDMSGWLLTGLPGLAFAGIVGSKEAIFTAIGLLIGTLLNWLLVARRLRVYTEVSSNSLTISSYLSNRFRDKSNVASTAFSNDVYTVFNKRFLKRNPSDKELMWTARITVFVLSMIGFVIAIDENSSIFRLVQYAWGGLGASFGPVILFSLYSKKSTALVPSLPSRSARSPRSFGNTDWQDSEASSPCTNSFPDLFSLPRHFSSFPC